jgi:hypothetical protein
LLRAAVQKSTHSQARMAAELSLIPEKSLPHVQVSWSDSTLLPPPPQAFPTQRVPCHGAATLTLEPWAGVWDTPLTFSFPNLSRHAPDPSGFFDVQLRLLADTEEVQCCLAAPQSGAVLEERRELFGTALERLTRAREDAAAAAALALRMADAARREAECATFAGRRALLQGATSEMHSVSANLFTLARQRCFLLHQHQQFADAGAFDLTGGSARKGEVVAQAAAQRDDVGAVDIQHPHLGPRAPRQEPAHLVLSEEEAFASVEDLRTGVLRLVSAAERAGAQRLALLRTAARAGLEGVSAPGAFTPWEQSQLRLLKGEFDAVVAGVSVEVVKG